MPTAKSSAKQKATKIEVKQIVLDDDDLDIDRAPEDSSDENSWPSSDIKPSLQPQSGRSRSSIATASSRWARKASPISELSEISDTPKRNTRTPNISNSESTNSGRRGGGLNNSRRNGDSPLPFGFSEQTARKRAKPAYGKKAIILESVKDEIKTAKSNREESVELESDNDTLTANTSPPSRKVKRSAADSATNDSKKIKKGHSTSPDRPGRVRRKGFMKPDGDDFLETPENVRDQIKEESSKRISPQKCFLKPESDDVSPGPEILQQSACSTRVSSRKAFAKPEGDDLLSSTRDSETNLDKRLTSIRGFSMPDGEDLRLCSEKESEYLSDTCPKDPELKPAGEESGLGTDSSQKEKSFVDRIRKHRKPGEKLQREKSKTSKAAFVIPDGDDVRRSESDLRWDQDKGPLLESIPDVVRKIIEEDGYGDLFENLNAQGARPPILSESTTNSMVKTGFVCPVCDEPVEQAELTSWVKKAGNKRFDFNYQTKFCNEHQIRSAKLRWDDKGYPEIEWENLTTRVSKHHPFICDLINGASCHYRQVLDEAITSGKHRTLKDMSTTLVPGYYGSRGLKIIQENIMEKYSKLLKERATKDRTISARGVPSFVQAVLVLEVARLLIMEDMNVSEDKALEVLKDSISLGELVNEEVSETIDTRNTLDEELCT